MDFEKCRPLHRSFSMGNGKSGTRSSNKIPSLSWFVRVETPIGGSRCTGPTLSLTRVCKGIFSALERGAVDRRRNAALVSSLLKRKGTARQVSRPGRKETTVIVHVADSYCLERVAGASNIQPLTRNKPSDLVASMPISLSSLQGLGLFFCGRKTVAPARF